ncbi:MAG: DUF5680 domain-containing protein [Oscillospiraceae bacterium]|jgi:hypothetical protein
MNERVIDFLMRAKKATYAGKGAESSPSRPSSHDLEFYEGTFKYIDSWLGGDRFAGEEALWENNDAFWVMNYMGRVIGEGFSGDFLKLALSKVPTERPFRGPSVFKDGEFLYICNVTGDFDWFDGYEEILRNGKKIYECRFHGGAVG